MKTFKLLNRIDAFEVVVSSFDFRVDAESLTVVYIGFKDGRYKVFIYEWNFETGLYF